MYSVICDNIHNFNACSISKNNLVQMSQGVSSPLCISKLQWINNTGQQNLTLLFGTRGKISNPNRTFNAEFKCVSSFSPSPTVCL